MWTANRTCRWVFAAVIVGGFLAPTQADAFIFDEIRALTRAATQVVKAVTDDIRQTTRTLREAVLPDRNSRGRSLKERAKINRKELRNQLERSERAIIRKPGDERSFVRREKRKKDDGPIIRRRGKVSRIENDDRGRKSPDYSRMRSRDALNFRDDTERIERKIERQQKQQQRKVERLRRKYERESSKRSQRSFP